jgi:hypothetical protein
MLCLAVADLPLDDWREEYRAMHLTVGSLMAVLTAHAPVRRLRGFAAASALMTISTGLAVGFTLVSLRLGAISRAEASNIRTELPASIQLAQAFTAALNAHDVDALVELFTEEDAGATVTADRFAWQKFEIRLWAQQQIQGGIRTEAYDYRLIEHGAAWNADVYRDDWQALGVRALRLSNSVTVHNGQLVDFTSRLAEPNDLLRLGRLWQPGAVPERSTTAWRLNTGPGQPLER